MTAYAATLRRPVRNNTALVCDTLGRLAEAGVDWAPRFVRRDGNEEVLSWLPGRTVDDWCSRPDLLAQLAEVVREFHDLTANPDPLHECLVHDDLQPRNVVVDGGQLGLIDWEQLRPGKRIEDVAQLCWSFAGPTPADDVDVVLRRWDRVIRAYGPIDRSELVPVAVAKLDRCIDDIERNAFAGSARHQVFLDRGDGVELARLRRWILDHAAEIAAT